MIILKCSVADLRSKEVINVDDGTRIGSVCDVEIDTCSGSLVAIIIWGRSKAFGLLGKYEDINSKGRRNYGFLLGKGPVVCEADARVLR